VTRKITFQFSMPRLRKRQRTDTLPSVAAASLPLPVLLLILAFTPRPRTLASWSLVNAACRAAVLGLPDWHSSGLEGGQLLEGRSVPIWRALAILVSRTCELCHRRSVKGFKADPFRVFAHKQCVEANLNNSYYLAEDVRHMVEAVRLPFEVRVGRSFGRHGGWDWTMTSYWTRLHPCLPPCMTVEGVVALRTRGGLQAAVRAAAALSAHRQANDAIAYQLYTAKCELADAAADDLQARKLQATASRRALLDSMLRDQGLPALDVLAREYGEKLRSDKKYLRGYLALRVTAPFSPEEAVRRLCTMTLVEPTLLARTVAAQPEARGRVAAARAASTQRVGLNREHGEKAAEDPRRDLPGVLRPWTTVANEEAGVQPAATTNTAVDMSPSVELASRVGARVALAPSQLG